MSLKSIIILVSLFVLFSTIFVFRSSISNLNKDDYQSALHPDEQIKTVKNKIKKKEEPYYSSYKEVISLADNYINSKAEPVYTTYVPPTYEDGEGHNEAKKTLMSNAYASYVLALSWKLTDNAKYAEKAIQILDNWAKENHFISERDDTPLVEAYGGLGFIYSGSLLKGYKNWDQEDFVKWVKNKYIPIVTVARNRTNNWGSWGNLALLASYSYLGYDKEFKSEINRTKYLILHQINSEGILEKEVSRKSGGMVYTYFSLVALTQSMYIIYNQTGINLFSEKTEEGRGINKALTYFYYYVKNPTQWPFYKNSDLNKPSMIASHNWPANLYKAMSGIYPANQFGDLTINIEPIMGGYVKDRELPSHFAWNFPSLMTPIVKQTE